MDAATERVTIILALDSVLSMKADSNAVVTGQESGERNPVALAFLLGWAVSETLGYLRKGVRTSTRAAERPADYAPRLTASQGDVTAETDGFLFSSERVAQFYRRLALESDPSPLTKQVYELPGKIRDWLDKGGKAPFTAHELRDLFEGWTLQVWAELNGASTDSARAFTAGLSLADTYWYMRLPSRRKRLKATQMSEEDWRRLLPKYRLDVARSRIETLKHHLPPYVADVIQNHLRSWSIGTTLGYQAGKLTIVKGAKATGELEQHDEADLQRALGRQVQNWETMLLSLREPQTFLRGQDRRLIMYGRWVGLFFAELATALFLLFSFAFVIVLLSVTILPSLIALITARQPGVGEWLSIISLVWTILIAVPAPIILRAAYQFTRTAQKWLDDWLTIYFITRRTYVPWDQYMAKGRGRTTKDEGRKTNAEGQVDK